ncbi:MAG: hypothetical protein ACQES0_07710 [Bacteroidota bacterium]
MLKKIKYLSLGIIIVSLCALNVQAQNKTGSPYTRYGLGDLQNKNFGDSRAMGNTSLAMRGGNKLYVANPASYTSIDSLRFIMEVGVGGSFKYMSSGTTGETASLYDMNLDYLSFGFPVTSYWGAAMGVMPYSDVGYDLVTSESSLGYPRKHYYAGSGGVNQAFLGSSFSLLDNLSLGVNFNYLFGSISQINTVEFDGEIDGMVDIREENTMYINDYYFSLGAQYTHNFSEEQALTLGITWDVNNTLNAKRDYIVSNSLSSATDVVVDTIAYESKEKGKISLPSGIGAGLAYTYKDVLTLAADYKFQDWTDNEIFGEVDSLGASQRVSMGAEYIPDGKSSASLSYAGKIRYRLGAYYHDSYLQFDQGNTRVNDFGISFGLGLPMKRSNTTFNLSLELGQRGSLKNNLVKEQYVLVGMNFSLADIWFIKRKFE